MFYKKRIQALEQEIKLLREYADFAKTNYAIQERFITRVNECEFHQTQMSKNFNDVISDMNKSISDISNKVSELRNMLVDTQNKFALKNKLK